MSKKLPGKSEVILSGGVCAATAVFTAVTLPWAAGGWVAYLGYRTFQKLRKVKAS